MFFVSCIAVNSDTRDRLVENNFYFCELFFCVLTIKDCLYKKKNKKKKFKHAFFSLWKSSWKLHINLAVQRVVKLTRSASWRRLDPRKSSPHEICRWLRSSNVRSVFHVSDDVVSLSKTLSLSKWPCKPIGVCKRLYEIKTTKCQIDAKRNRYRME